MMAGEISLNGEIHAISEILPIIIRAGEEKCRFCVVPYENLREATLIPDMKVIGVRNLQEMIRYVQSRILIERSGKNNRNLTGKTGFQ